MFSTEVSVVERSRRQEEKLPLELRARYGGAGIPTRALCKVTDLTNRGARLSVYCDLEPDSTIMLTLPLAGAVRARVLWSKDFEAGCRFQTPLTDEDMEFISRQGYA